MPISTYSKLQASLLKRAEINDQKWNQFIEESPQGATYAKSWYLDEVCPNWQAIIISKSKVWQAVFPFCISYKYGVFYSFKPHFCQYLGIFFKPFTRKLERELSIKKGLVKKIIQHIPKKIKVFHHSFAPEFDYSFPFHWEGYSLKTRYSFWLDTDRDIMDVYESLSGRVRQCLRKSEREGITISKTEDISQIIEIGIKYSKLPKFQPEMLKRLWKTLIENNAGRAIIVRDKNGNYLCGIIYLKSGDRYIYLFGVKDPNYGNSGAMTAAIWHVISANTENIKCHDFGGSMLESIEHFNRGFGARPVPYLDIYKNNFPKMLHWVM